MTTTTMMIVQEELHTAQPRRRQGRRPEAAARVQVRPGRLILAAGTRVEVSIAMRGNFLEGGS